MRWIHITGSRFTTTHDFGFVTLDILQCVPEDSGVYMCKAYNLAGEAVSSCTTRVIGECNPREGYGSTGTLQAMIFVVVRLLECSRIRNLIN